MQVEIDVEKTLKAIDTKLDELESVMNILYTCYVPTLREAWLRGSGRLKNKKNRNPNWLIKRNVKKLLSMRLSYGNDAFSMANNHVQVSTYGKIFEYLSALELRIIKTSDEFPNQPIVLSEEDLDYIFVTISQQDISNEVVNFRHYINGNEMRHCKK